MTWPFDGGAVSKAGRFYWQSKGYPTDGKRLGSNPAHLDELVDKKSSQAVVPVREERVPRVGRKVGALGLPKRKDLNPEAGGLLLARIFLAEADRSGLVLQCLLTVGVVLDKRASG